MKVILTSIAKGKSLDSSKSNITEIRLAKFLKRTNALAIKFIFDKLSDKNATSSFYRLICNFLIINRDLVQKISINLNGITTNAAKAVIYNLVSVLQVQNNLRSLYLINIQIDKILAYNIGVCFKNCHNLKNLYLKSVYITPKAVKVLAIALKNIKLEKLNIYNVNIVDFLSYFLNNNIRKLKIYNNYFYYNQIFTISTELESGVVLKELVLNNIEILTSNRLMPLATALANNKSLKKLDLSNCDITTEGFITLIEGHDASCLNQHRAGLRYNHSLTEINFSNTGMSLKTMLLLLSYNTNFNNLRTLNLSHNNINFLDDGFYGVGQNNINQQLVSYYLQRTSLTSLDLSYNKIHYFMTVAVRKGLVNSQLTYLNLSHNSISDYHGKDLALASSESNLLYLDLSDNLLNENTAKAFLKLFQQKQQKIITIPLSNINLNNNHMTAQGLKWLEEINNITDTKRFKNTKSAGYKV